ncbi:kinase-like protein [Gigaspora margarita]|uniref:Kinase-like protein n=1 Tax=Gigaspora margarita TaxID=4874 RepID=A0A8H4B1F1_GIGMA|nr:kinase-like protein [Gigaspora margarita]
MIFSLNKKKFVHNRTKWCVYYNKYRLLLSAVIHGYTITEEWYSGSTNNVCIAIKDSREYALKFFKDEAAFKHEVAILTHLKNSQNIVQLVEILATEKILVLEHGICDLQTYIRKPTWVQSHQHTDEIKKKIVKDVVAGLEQCHKRGIIHTNLTPKNIVLFHQGAANLGTWKLIDFDTSHRISTPTTLNAVNYCSPEVAKADFVGKTKKAHPSMDMFSFGLVLFFMETGYHYWKRRDLWSIGPPLTKIEKLEFLRSKESLVVNADDIGDISKREIINDLLKPKKRRMTLTQFKKTIYYSEDSDENITNAIVLLDREEEDKYKQLMSLIPQEWEKIGPKLFKLRCEKIPRLFIVIPLIPSWKNQKTWTSQSFRLYFVCEHVTPHVHEHKGCYIQNPLEFIKKYGAYIKFCHHLVSARTTYDTFPQEIIDHITKLFHVPKSSNLLNYIAKIGDQIHQIVNELPPVTNGQAEVLDLDDDASHYYILNSAGLRELKEYFNNTNMPPDHLIEARRNDTNDFVWICERHSRDQLYEANFLTSGSNVSHSSHVADMENIPVNNIRAIIDDIIGNTSFRPQLINEFNNTTTSTMDVFESWYQDSNTTVNNREHLTDSLGKYSELLLRLLSYQVHRSHAKKTLWVSAKKDRQDIIKLKEEYKMHMTKLMEALIDKSANIILPGCKGSRLSSNDSFLRYEDDKFTMWSTRINELYELYIKQIKVRCLSTTILRESYIPTNKIKELSNVNKRHGSTFYVVKSKADSNVVAAKRLLKNVINLNMLYCVEKEIYLFRRCLAPCDHIIGFFGVTMKDNIPCLLMEWAQDGNLYQYMKTYKTVEKKKMSWQFKINLALDIAKAVSFLHENGIIHLDIRSHNVLLTHDKKAKLSNFLWSRKLDDEHTLVSPTNHKPGLRNRWMEPQQLLNPPKSKLDFKSDIYSMAILLWEIADGRGTLPHAHIPDRLLKEYVVDQKGRDGLPYDDEEYQPECVVFNKLVRKMWAWHRPHRPEIMLVVTTLERISNIGNIGSIMYQNNLPNIPTMDQVSRMYHNKQYSEALPFLIRYADNGDSEACEYLTTYYRDGLGGLDRDVGKAMEYSRKSGTNKSHKIKPSQNES